MAAQGEQEGDIFGEESALVVAADGREVLPPAEDHAGVEAGSHRDGGEEGEGRDEARRPALEVPAGRPGDDSAAGDRGVEHGKGPRVDPAVGVGEGDDLAARRRGPAVPGGGDRPFLDRTTRQPRSRANSAVPSVEALSATMTSTVFP